MTIDQSRLPSREPEFPRPEPGSELLIVKRATRYREQEIQKVRVRAMARFRIVLEDPDGNDLPWHSQEWDIRTRAPWDNNRSYRMGSGPDKKLHTAGTWAWQQRADEAEKYLSECRLHLWDLRAGLRDAVKADPVGFVNVLRRFEGLEEI